MKNEPVPSSASTTTSPSTEHSLYSSVSPQILREIKSIDLTFSYGSKIDMMTRHLLYLRRSDRAFKAVIFSQWQDVLDVIKDSLRRADIGFATLEKSNGIDHFRERPEVNCFLLHAKSQSAGLTLVNATHVFLCEPLLNVGLELQAVSRVHRIGQKMPTTVWLYAVNNTVEQSVLELATRRRLAFVGGGTATEEQIEKAESEGLRDGIAKLVEKTPGGGEMVQDDDLWACLFGTTPVVDKKKAQIVGRQLRAGKAELRMGEKGPR